MSQKTAARIAVRDSLIHMVTVNRQFREQIYDDHLLPAWVMKPSETDKEDRVLAAETSTKLTYTDEQNKQETARLPGIVGISSETLQTGLMLNEAREAFKQAMSEFRKLYGDSIEAIEETSEEIRENMLGGLQISHIHFVQSYRQLKLFETPPKRIGFSWAAHHSGSVKLSANEAIDHLRKKYLASTAIQKDIQILEQMPASETVIIKRILSPHLRANLTWAKDIELLRKADKDLRKLFPGQINTPLPVFVQLEKGQPLPEFNRIRAFDPSAKQERLTRSDARLVKISENPHSKIYKYA
ncbi:MAG: DNA replication terminus site-binding protein [Endozoicomonas sp.]|uniref:DNA replication terminus site-binding protein n=1 Tax=Endozoicomonas sp. TaxID=1892382 RepID=UPI003D9ABAB6